MAEHRDAPAARPAAFPFQRPAVESSAHHSAASGCYERRAERSGKFAVADPAVAGVRECRGAEHRAASSARVWA